MLDAGQCDASVAAIAAMKALFHFVAERVGGAFDTRAGNRHDIDSDSSSNSSRADISALSASAAVGLFIFCHNRIH